MTLFYLLALAFGLVIMGAVAALLLGLRSAGQARAWDDSRAYFSSDVLTLEDVELSQPFGDRVIRPAISSLVNALGRFTPQRNAEQIRQKLEAAGRPHGWRVTDIYGLRVLSSAASALVSFMLLLLTDVAPTYKVLLAVALGILGFYLPIVWLNLRVNQRKAAILRALPDGLDMLNICVGAGLGFDAALSRVGDRWQTPLAQEFNRVVTEIRLGKTRRHALLDMAERTDVPQVRNFVATIVQADQLGVSIAKVLRTQAEQMRLIRRQRAEELARKATIKLLFPLVFLIFPSLLAVLLGPAVPQLINTLGNLSP